MKKTKNNKGFSLVELIVVVAIMAVLMGILIPTLIKNVSKSKRGVDGNTAAEVVGGIKRVFASDPDLFDDYVGDVPDTYTMTWNSNSKKADFKDDPIAYAVFDDFGKTPVSKFDKRLTWKLIYDGETGEIKIYLVDSPSDTSGYQVYPDANAYVKNKAKTAISQ